MASFRHTLNHIGAAVPDGDLVAQIVGPPMDDTFHAMELGDRVEDAIAAFRAGYGARGWAMNTLFDGIAPLLADLRAAGFGWQWPPASWSQRRGGYSHISGSTRISR
ncbi:putative 5'-nucleotidase [Mycobacterium ulcerans str. Harvey]|uniref:5'-nucleotidase n=1 Tax=Mycobacterium ulcerans str. Harvey TaxID=1299332 RepID=A0ABP3AKC5_MYCUL|nr:putative 5'-nucleotidase [Mycobacterium ulcerans str. Harvey]